MIEWQTEYNRYIDYTTALNTMEKRVNAIINGQKQELVWLLEHSSLYTAGTSAKQQDLLQPDRFPVFYPGRGGEYTYHGPGQRIAYLMLDLQKHCAKDLRKYIYDLEEWMIRVLADFNVIGQRKRDRIGIWVITRQKEKKIAAIGVRIRKWVTYHGIALNIAPDLSHYNGIVPCGVRNYGVTSLADLSIYPSMQQVDESMRKNFASIFTKTG